MLRIRRPLALGAAALLAASAATVVLTGTGFASLTARVPATESLGLGRSSALGPVLQGATSPTERVTILATLRLPDRAGLAAFVRHVSDPSDPRYGHYLTPQEFRARYAPPDLAVAATESFLRVAGFSIDYVPANHRFVAAT